jgi:hypothetical protein
MAFEHVSRKALARRRGSLGESLELLPLAG